MSHKQVRAHQQRQGHGECGQIVGLTARSERGVEAAFEGFGGSRGETGGHEAGGVGVVVVEPFADGGLAQGVDVEVVEGVDGRVIVDGAAEEVVEVGGRFGGLNGGADFEVEVEVEGLAGAGRGGGVAVVRAAVVAGLAAEFEGGGRHGGAAVGGVGAHGRVGPHGGFVMVPRLRQDALGRGGCHRRELVADHRHCEGADRVHPAAAPEARHEARQVVDKVLPVVLHVPAPKIMQTNQSIQAINPMPQIA